MDKLGNIMFLQSVCSIKDVLMGYFHIMRCIKFQIKKNCGNWVNNVTKKESVSEIIDWMIVECKKCFRKIQFYLRVETFALF